MDQSKNLATNIDKSAGLSDMPKVEGIRVNLANLSPLKNPAKNIDFRVTNKVEELADWFR